MKTPLEYTKSINNKVITRQMLNDCIYSSNKRAKNWRDKQQEYRDKREQNRYWTDRYNNEAKAKERKDTYYAQKAILLSLLEPTCIHKEVVGYERERIYDYEPEYDKYLNDFVWKNRYYDESLGAFVYFGDLELKDQPKYNYYLFYDDGCNHTFHNPIEEDDIAEYPNLPVREISGLITKGRDIADLLSNQFVMKVISVIESGEYIFK